MMRWLIAWQVFAYAPIVKETALSSGRFLSRRQRRAGNERPDTHHHQFCGWRCDREFHSELLEFAASIKVPDDNAVDVTPEDEDEE